MSSGEIVNYQTGDVLPNLTGTQVGIISRQAIYALLDGGIRDGVNGINSYGTVTIVKTDESSTLLKLGEVNAKLNNPLKKSAITLAGLQVRCKDNFDMTEAGKVYYGTTFLDLPVVVDNEEFFPQQPVEV